MLVAHCGIDTADGRSPELLSQVGPSLIVDIGFDVDWGGEGRPKLLLEGVHALVDSGAAECCIDSGVALQLNLPIVDQKPYGGIGGVHMLNVHMAQIFVPELDYAMWGQFAGVNLAGSGIPHAALIGRNFLRHFILTYNGLTGAVTLSEAQPTDDISTP
ncbi:MAG TPA: hypothetical protein VGG92_03930 [Caulobacteraceae bacterium]|jgi:hypothetical protein